MRTYPVPMYPITFWLLFGGFIFLQQYVSVDTFMVGDAEPISEVAQPELDDVAIAFALFPQAVAAEPADAKFMAEYMASGGPMIEWDKKKYAVEDVRFESKVATNGKIYVYKKATKEVKWVKFSTNIFK